LKKKIPVWEKERLASAAIQAKRKIAKRRNRPIDPPP